MTICMWALSRSSKCLNSLFIVLSFLNKESLPLVIENTSPNHYNAASVLIIVSNTDFYTSSALQSTYIR